jgi:mannose-6-phosphate isomerase
MDPLTFTPLLMERVWGGRRLERFGRVLPDGSVIGESWELVDNGDQQSVVRDGPLAGRTLAQLWQESREQVFGARGVASASDHFPILVKLLDAEQTLSVQVHPPAHVAPELGGRPKTECWFVLDTEPGAQLFAGLGRNVTRESFECALLAGEDVSELLTKLPVAAGDAMMIPSGRVHAIGAGCVIAEVQQTSDTTYRVFDFNRAGLDGEPRELHVAESMRSIDWDDVEPALVEPSPAGEIALVNNLFEASRVTLTTARPAGPTGECTAIIPLSAPLLCAGREFAVGELFLVAASDAQSAVEPSGGASEMLEIRLPRDVAP